MKSLGHYITEGHVIKYGYKFAGGLKQNKEFDIIFILTRLLILLQE